MKVKPLFEFGCHHGEGPIWDSKNQQLYWVDMMVGNIHAGNPVTKDVQTIAINQPIGALGLREEGGLVMALRDGFAFWEEGNLKIIHNPEADNPETRFNDGAVGPGGRFWAGTMTYDGQQPIGHLYCLHTDQTVSTHEEGLFISNGMAWSADKKQYFLTDTLAHVIYQYDYDLESGQIHNRREFIKFKENELPDGLTMDQKGNLWIAMWQGWSIWVYNQHGIKINEIPLPVEYPTSCCFGGEHLQTLFITSSRRDIPTAELPNQPLSGSVLYLEFPGKGRPEPYYTG